MKEKKPSDQKEDSFFGASIILYLVLAAISFLFLGVMGAYLYNRAIFELAPMYIPDIFYLNTLLIIGVSVFVTRSLKAFQNSHFARLFSSWTYIFVGLLVFITLQLVGWQQMIAIEQEINSNNSASYIYALSSLHIIHILIGLPFHGKILWKLWRIRQQDDFSRIEYLAQKQNRDQLVLTGRYWHFLDGLWVLLMVFFLLNSLF